MQNFPSEVPRGVLQGVLQGCPLKWPPGCLERGAFQDTPGVSLILSFRASLRLPSRWSPDIPPGCREGDLSRIFRVCPPRVFCGVHLRVFSRVARSEEFSLLGSIANVAIF
jgi:hypothetical protein